MKKIFGLVVLAVAAMTFVSCSKTSPVTGAMEKAGTDKDIARLIAIADSVKGVGDKADALDKGQAIVCYATAYTFMKAAMIDPSAAKGFDEYKNDATKMLSFSENFVSLYESNKDNEDVKKCLEAAKQGGIDIDAMINEVKPQIEVLKGAIAGQAAQVEGAEAAEGEEVAEEAAEEAAEEEAE